MVKNGPADRHGVLFDGNLTGAFILRGIAFENVDACAARKTGSHTQSRGSVTGCDGAASCNSAILWQTSKVPSKGLLITANTMNLTPFYAGGITSATAGVNAKANADSGGLLQETAIIP